LPCMQHARTRALHYTRAASRTPPPCAHACAPTRFLTHTHAPMPMHAQHRGPVRRAPTQLGRPPDAPRRQRSAAKEVARQRASRGWLGRVALFSLGSPTRTHSHPVPHSRPTHKVPKPSALRPPDWDDDEDGEWSPPLIPNPKCVQAERKGLGCGEWTPPQVMQPGRHSCLPIATSVACMP
jgi:hypothetical protein